MENKAMITVLYLLGCVAVGACGDAGGLMDANPGAPGFGAPRAPETPTSVNPGGAPKTPPVDSEPAETPSDDTSGRQAASGYDVAENMVRFVFDDSPVDPDGLPQYGNSFVTQGYIYPFGFLEFFEGTNPDGTPAFPELVLGIWTCRGHFIGDGAATETGPWVVSTQLYDFFETPGFDPRKASGRHNLVSEGVELADVGQPVQRAITGATGRPREGGRVLEQQLLGFNESGGVDLRVVIPKGFEPVIPMDELPTGSLQQVEARGCVYDIVHGVVCDDV